MFLVFLTSGKSERLQVYLRDRSNGDVSGTGRDLPVAKVRSSEPEMLSWGSTIAAFAIEYRKLCCLRPAEDRSPNWELCGMGIETVPYG